MEIKQEPEIWKPIRGYEGLYEISSYGRVKSLRKNIILKYQIHNGYPILHLFNGGAKNRKGFNIHRLVGINFINNPNNYPEINHLDGNKQNNYYKNLEWCTSEHNIEHAIKNKLVDNTGLNNSQCKLTECQVLEIRKLHLENKIKQNYLSKIYNISQTQISRIINNKKWKHL